MPTDRMGPPPGAPPPMRMTASWSGSNNPTAYKSVAPSSAPNGELPSDPQQTDRQAPTRHRSYAKTPVAVHHRSACSGVKALRNTSAARRQAAKLCYRFGPLTPSARSANLIAGDGTENGFPAPNKELVTNPKQLLDRKSLIQVRIRLPPAQSQERTTERSLRRTTRQSASPTSAMCAARNRDNAEW
jgi:hypothetical protein